MQTTVSLTTMKQREESLKDTIASLIDQVDRINVYLHGYNSEIPDFLKHQKIVVAEGEDNGDLDKFHWIGETVGWHFIVDDDLIFPSTYAEDSIKAINNIDLEAFYSYHGSIPFTLPIASYYQDRFIFPCLEEVTENTSVKILGTGTLVYFTDKPINFNYEKLERNMADIHFSELIKNSNKIVLSHSKDYIKHTDKIDLLETIFEQNKDNDFIQTHHINSNPKIFNTKRFIDDLPLVSIVVVNSRGTIDPGKVKVCYDSIRNQDYENLEVIEILNVEKLVTIGKAFNDGVSKSRGKYVLFVGDDDFITSDYVSSLVSAFERQDASNCVGMSTYLTIFDDEGNLTKNELVPTGMWLTKWLKENPFKEFLTKYVDSELFARLKETDKVVKVISYHYGYYYRSHDNQVSGKKNLLQKENLVIENNEIINKIITGIK